MIIDDVINELREKGYSIGEFTSDVVENKEVCWKTKNRLLARKRRRILKAELMKSIGM